MSGRAAGFSLIEVIVGLAIMVMLAAVVTPEVMGTIDRARVEKGGEALQGVAAAVAAFEADLDRYPGRLAHLAAPVSTGETNSCGYSFVKQEVDDWDGPYLDRMVPAAGFAIPLGQVQDELIREPPAATGPGRSPKKAKGGATTGAGTLSVQVEGVREEDALAVDAEIDGAQDGAGGSIQYTVADESGMVTLYYVLPISGC